MANETVKQKMERQVIEDIEDYFESFDFPCNCSKVQKRSSRLLKHLGVTIVQAVRQLHKDGKVKMLVTEKLTRFIVPINVWNDLTDEQKLLLRNKIERSREDSDEVNSEENRTVPSSNFFQEPENRHKEDSIDF